jgi:hypothetical protein
VLERSGMITHGATGRGELPRQTDPLPAGPST